MTRGYDPQRLFERLHAAGVRYVIIGGWAVNAHGHRRFTGDLDICPDPAFDNLSRLADLLAELNARQLGVEDFEPDELPGDPTDAASLAEGGNFRTETDDGILNIMRWIFGDDRELGYGPCASELEDVERSCLGVERYQSVRVRRCRAGPSRGAVDQAATASRRSWMRPRSAGFSTSATRIAAESRAF